MLRQLNARAAADQMATENPYDEVPYKCLPVEWTAPERLALTSLLHGGPRQRLERYRVLELGCGDGANVLPLAYHRPQGSFVGLDGAAKQIKIATAHQAALGLRNVEFINSDFLDAHRHLSGEFDFIVAHGIFSWVSDEARDALFDICAARLASGGLLYLNYNSRPGWNVRGMVREFLLAQTAATLNLATRSLDAQAVSRRVLAALVESDHPYSRLLANEFQFVADSHPSYVAHEFLAVHNRPYWRSEFMQLAEHHGFACVADADFYRDSGRIVEGLRGRLAGASIIGRSLDDTVDLLCYRQLHSPVFTRAPFTPRPASVQEWADLIVASCLDWDRAEPESAWTFVHPTGYRVEAREEVLALALADLRGLWPRGRRIGDLFSDVPHVADDLRLLHRNGLIELRCVEPAHVLAPTEALRRLEARYGGYMTSPYHTREPVVAA